MRRIFLVILILGLMCCITVPGCERSSFDRHLERLKTSFLNPEYYLVSHHGFPIGTYSRVASINDNKEYEFNTKLSLHSANGLRLTTDSAYLFRNRRPYSLAIATRTTHADTIEVPYRVEQLYPAEKSDATGRKTEAEEDPYGMKEFFALELALMRESGQIVSADKTTVLPIRASNETTSWEILSKNTESVNVLSSSGDRATFSYTDGIPQLDSLVDDTGLSLTRISVDDFAKLEIKPPHVVEQIKISVDRPIETPKAVSALHVQFEFADGLAGPWANLLDERLSFTSIRKPRTTSNDLVKWESEPRDVRAIDELESIVAAVVNEDDEPHQIVNKLVAFVNETIKYKNWNMLQSVEETLDQRVGDCTELSQLFTALATTAGLTARTVVGLAYHESSQTFGIHAWNEVRLNDGTVRFVDPTWNQNLADATHIEFPSAYQHEIVQTLKNLRIKVLSVVYDS